MVSHIRMLKLNIVLDVFICIVFLLEKCWKCFQHFFVHLPCGLLWAKFLTLLFSAGNGLILYDSFSYPRFLVVLPTNFLVLPPIQNSNQSHERYHEHIFSVKMHEENYALLYDSTMLHDRLLAHIWLESQRDHQTLVLV